MKLDDKYYMSLAERGTGKLEFYKEILPILMTRHYFACGRYKALTIIKLLDYDDIFVLYGTKLVLITYTETFFEDVELEQKYLNGLAKELYPTIALKENSFYGTFFDFDGGNNNANQN